MKNFEKIVHVGKGESGNVFCRIKFTDGRLSITGVEGPKRNGDAIGSCGQIVMSDWYIKDYAPGWSPEMEEKFRAVWKEWHLNDMQAGSPAQTAWIKANPLDCTYPKSHYDVYSAALTEAGLNPDPTYLYNGKLYKYGSAWLKVEVPAEVIEFLTTLPDTDIKPAWV